MRFAYADPPYPGQAHKYRQHTDYAGEVDHAKLIEELTTYDGWALSTSAIALPAVLPLCPPTVRLAVWHVTNSEPPGYRGTWWWCWEPVILTTPRAPGPVPVRNLLSTYAPTGFLGNELPGQKPETFSRWLFHLAGLGPDDAFVDMFPGSGAVGRAWTAWTRQRSLFYAAGPDPRFG